MGRVPRVYIENACYHLYTRGNHKKVIFENDNDYVYCLNLIKKAKEKFNIPLYCYCLMPNHLHLLLKPQIAINISNFMHWVNKGYTVYFNKKYEKVGHLWQGRFRSKPVLEERYLENLAEYIENNPVRAKIVSHAGDYLWSSYRERCLSLKGNGLVDLFTAETFSTSI